MSSAATAQVVCYPRVVSVNFVSVKTRANMALEEIKVKFAGKWKLDRSENFEDFLREMGVNVMLRKKANSSRPEQEIEVKNGTIRISTKTGLAHHEDILELGKEVERKHDKIKQKIRVTYTEGRLEVTSRPLTRDVKPQRITRELINGEMVMTIHVGEVECKRIFRRLDRKMFNPLPSLHRIFE